mmetsp:Transcript_12873/g.26280  ORF Transcript_12873/g.26280 Transcript_12873/m.26280 type:complete len:208 (-) Transcript_12873:44-667(-)
MLRVPVYCMLFIAYLSTTTSFLSPPVSIKCSHQVFSITEAAAPLSNPPPVRVKRITTLNDFRDELMISKSENKLLVVKFYAEWCKSCAKVKLPFESMAKTHPNANFIQVPVTPTNSDLHHGLGVPSLPFAHVYHPTAGLVEERRITRARFRDFEKDFRNYVSGSCDVVYDADLSESDSDVRDKIENGKEVTAGRIVRDFLKRRVTGS